MQSGDKGVLGCGWSFPPEFDKKNGVVHMVEAEADIVQSLQILLSTAKTERVMLPDYGCQLSTLVFEDMNAALAQRIQRLVCDAILYYEPRIEVHEGDIMIAPGEQGLLPIVLSYRIRQTNTRSNMVFPFYCVAGPA